MLNLLIIVKVEEFVPILNSETKPRFYISNKRIERGGGVNTVMTC